MEQKKFKRQSGFSLAELLMVATILIVIAAVAIPQMLTAVHSSALQGAGRDLGSLLQQARMLAIKDNHFYAVYVIPGTDGAPGTAFIDVYPQSATGISGNHDGTSSTGDPMITIPPEVVPNAKTSAPATANLKSQWLPATSTITPVDAYSGTTPTPFFFGPDGLPCTTATVTGGTTCRGNMTQTAYWTFFQDSTTQKWIAVTVTPAGRIHRWQYSGSSWSVY